VDLHNMLRIAGRHLVIVAVGLVATLVAGVYLVSQVEPEYEAKASVLLLTPSQVETPEGPLDRNPLENPQGVLTTATALINVMRDLPFAERLEAEGLVGSYEVNDTPAGAIIDIRTTGLESEQTFADLQLLIGEMRAELADIQRRAGIAETTWIRAEILTVPNEAAQVSGSKVRVLGVTLLLGVAATYTLAFAADLLYGGRRFVRGRRQRRRGAERGDPDDSGNRGDGDGESGIVVGEREAADERADSGSLFNRAV
jgi:capsular polysaccharide biosynthesis protein